MKSLHLSSRGLATGVAIAGLALLVSATTATSANRLYNNEITPGKTMGYVKLGMTRKTVERKLNDLHAPQRTHDGRFYSLTYRHYRYNHTSCSGRKLFVVFHGRSRSAHAVYAGTLEPCLVTNDGGISVFDQLQKLQDAYSVSCYHSNPDGSRDSTIEEHRQLGVRAAQQRRLHVLLIQLARRGSGAADWGNRNRHTQGQLGRRTSDSHGPDPGRLDTRQLIR